MADPTLQLGNSGCSLDDPKLREVLERLHHSARGDVRFYPKIGLSMLMGNPGT